MRKYWRLAVVLGGAGGLLVCLALPVLPYFWRIAQFRLAQQRWEQLGAENYTLVIGRDCFCADLGEYQLIVRDGAVVSVEPVGNSPAPLASTPPLIHYYQFTVEASLDRAEHMAHNSGSVPWFTLLTIDYDSTYGYVTDYYSNANGWLTFLTGDVPDVDLRYTARDLQILAP